MISTENSLSAMEAFYRKTQPLKAAFAKKSKQLRGVPVVELEKRLAHTQDLMEKDQLDCILLTTEQDVYYFTGLATRFWNSPTRPFFLIIPSRSYKRPIAVIPSVFPSFGTASWLGPENIRSWPAPQPGDDGVSLLSQTLTELKSEFSRVGFMMSLETHVRAPLSDVDQIRKNLAEANISVVDGSSIIKQVRVVKTPFEIERARHACQIASAAFAALPARLNAMKEESVDGITERDARDALRLTMIEFGADDTSYVMTQSGQGGYNNIVLEPSDDLLVPGDVLVIDTGM